MNSETRFSPFSIDSPDFVYKVAYLAWKEGLTAASIARKLGHGGDAAVITHVKRALRKASKLGILVLNPPKITDYGEKLKKKWPRVDFTIVRDDRLAKGDAVHIVASDVLAKKMSELWSTGKDNLVVANAGGHAVSETVRYLHERIGPILEPQPGRHLVFISLNSAGRARSFRQSSNFLAVQLAEIYGGEHIAVLGPADTSADTDYGSLASNIDLLLCGAGGPKSLLVERAKEEGIEVPPAMVGDIAFLPLDEKGRPIKHPIQQKISENRLHAAPPYEEILRIAAQPPRTVLVVLTGDSKLRIALALLRGALVSHLVMDVTLANSLSDMPAR